MDHRTIFRAPARWARLATLWAVLLGGLGPAAAYDEYRIKIDRYEASALPDVKLWVSLLAGDEPVDPKGVEGLSVWIDGEPTREKPDFKPAAKVGAPMALGILLDARMSNRYADALDAIPQIIEKLPDDSVAFAGAIAGEPIFVPAESEFEKKALKALPATLKGTAEAQDVERSQVMLGVMSALYRFPLREGFEIEADEEGSLLHDPKNPVPEDRVLLVVSSGNLGTVLGRSQLETLRMAIDAARRRGVRVMAVGVGDDEEGHLPLRMLARKSGGTFRRADTPDAVQRAILQAREELRWRLVITAEAPSLRRGDEASFQVGVSVAGEVEPVRSRDFTARADNRMGFIARTLDRISTWWETAPWWVHLLIIGGLLLVVTLVVLGVLLKKAKKARADRAAAAAARAAALEARRPCPVCGAVLLPDWKLCPFCAQAQADTGPRPRFRLTGRTGDYAGQVLRFPGDMLTLGTDPACGLRLNARGVAPHHCAIRERGDDWVVIDLNSPTGTFLNGQRVGQSPLGEGDVVAVGEDAFIFGLER